MVAKNDITGDSIQTKASNEAFAENVDRIFNFEERRIAKEKEKAEYFAKLNAKQDEFELESLDPDERSWYYDEYGIKRRKE